MRIVTEAERLERARAYRAILEAKLTIAGERAMVARAKFERARAVALKLQDFATFKENAARQIGVELERAYRAMGE